MSYSIIRPATHDEWLEERKKGIGASEVGTIFGCSPFKTPLKLFLEKTGKLPPVQETPAMREGHWFEFASAAAFADMNDVIIDPSTEGDWLAVDDDLPHLRVSPDRCFWPKDTPVEDRTPENWMVLELKSTARPVDPENPPIHWILQLQYQMGVLGAKRGALCWIDKTARGQEPAFGYHFYDLKENTYATIRKKLDEFWRENICKDVAPDPITGDDVTIIYKESKPARVAASEELEKDIEKLLELKARTKDIKDETDMIADRIKVALGEADTLTSADGKKILATWKTRNSIVFDSDAFRSKHPKLWEALTFKQLDVKLLIEEHQDIYKEFTRKVPTSERTLRIA